MATNTGQTQIRQNINARSQYVFTEGKIISATKENHSPNGQQPAPPVGFAKNLFDKTLFIVERNFAHSLEKLCSSVGRNFAHSLEKTVHPLGETLPFVRKTLFIRWKKLCHSLEKTVHQLEKLCQIVGKTLSCAPPSSAHGDVSLALQAQTLCRCAGNVRQASHAGESQALREGCQRNHAP